MGELPPNPFESWECNLEPKWLSDVAEGYLRERYLKLRLVWFLAVPPIIPLSLIGIKRIRKPPLCIRVWEAIKRAFTFEVRM